MALRLEFAYVSAGLVARSQFASEVDATSRVEQVFLGTTANADFARKFHGAFTASHLSPPPLPSVYIKLLRQDRPRSDESKYRQIPLMCSEAVLYSKQDTLRNPLPSSLPYVLPFLKRTFSRRVNRHCLGTFKAGKLF
jgi:hypothetical protein